MERVYTMLSYLFRMDVAGRSLPHSTPVALPTLNKELPVIFLSTRAKYAVCLCEGSARDTDWQQSSSD